jgi:glycosyltransferase involved in cell wall biosynthesis
MRILNICAYTWEIGGPARTIYDHTSEALKAGHQVDILSPFTPGDKLYPAPDGARIFPCKRTPFISRIYREFSWELLDFIKRHVHEYDVIHIHGIWHFGSLAPFLVKNRAAKVITIHGLLDQWALQQSKWKKQLVTSLFQKRLLLKADRIHVLNRTEEEDVIRYLGQRPDTIVCIPNGINISDYSDLPPKGNFRKALHISSDKKLVLFMSRLNKKKGLDLLLPAFESYQKKHRNTVLILAGPDDGYLTQAEQYIKDNDLSEHIKMAGMLTGETKKSALSDADVFVLPTYSEGLSIAVLENMAAGVASVVSSHTGLDQEIQQYQAAAVTKLSSEDIEAQLEKVLHDDDYRKTLISNASRMIEENFDISAVSQRLINEYQKIQIR